MYVIFLIKLLYGILFLEILIYIIKCIEVNIGIYIKKMTHMSYFTLYFGTYNPLSFSNLKII